MTGERTEPLFNSYERLSSAFADEVVYSSRLADFIIDHISPMSIDPLFSSTWPRCDHTIVAFGGVALVCTLPKHHRLDGQFEHQNDDYTRWWGINE